MIDPLDRYLVVVDVGEKSTDYAWHIIDTESEWDDEFLLYTDSNPNEESRRERLYRHADQCICPHNASIFGEEMTLSEANNHLTTTKEGFTGEAPDQICSYCWSEVKERITQQQESDAVNIDYSSTGFRLRWKQKGRAREEWYDIVVTPETTFNELDSLLRGVFSTLDGFHARLYGLEDEYMDSSLDIYGGIREGIVDKPDPRYREPPIYIEEVFSEHRLDVDDRLSLAYDFGIPSSYYCIIKERVDPTRFPDERDEDSLIASTDTAAVTRSKESRTRSSSTTDATDATEDNGSGGSQGDETASTEARESDNKDESKTVEDVFDTFSSQLNEESNKEVDVDFAESEMTE